MRDPTLWRPLAPDSPVRGAGKKAGGPRLSREAGASTIELAATLVIIGVVTASIVGLVGNVLEVNRARGAADQVASSMQLARQYAIANAATYTVTLTGTTVAVTCTTDCPPSSPSEPPVAILHGVTTSVPLLPIGFGPLGTGSPPGTVVVTYPGSPPWEVRVSEAGRIRTCTPSCP